jgi:hypothetical protein
MFKFKPNEQGVESMQYDVYRVTASYEGQEVEGIAAFTRGTDISTKYGQDAFRDCVSRTARAKFGRDVDLEIVKVEQSVEAVLPEAF